MLNTEEAVRDVVTQEVMSLEPRAFRAISVDIDSIEIKRKCAPWLTLAWKSGLTR